MFAIVIESIAALLVLGMLYQYVSSKRDQRKLPPMGEMIDIGTHRLHVLHSQSFQTGPSVILEAGGGMTSSSWMLVQPEIAKFANCISYDRAGLGYSEQDPSPATILNSVNDLYQLLAKLNLPKPYILVGHSYAGLLNQLYAKLHPDDVAGIVLVDATHEEWLKIVPFPSAGALTLFRILTFFGVLRLFIRKLFPLPKTLPVQMRQRIYAEASVSKGIVNNKAIFTKTNIKKIFAAFADIPRLNKPLTVITAGLRSGPERKFAEKQTVLQKDLVSRSIQGQQVIAEKSGHFIPFWQPELIVSAVDEMIKKLEKEGSANPL